MNGQWPARPEYTYDEVFPREHVFKYTEQIRKALQQDTIDVLQFHVWNDDWSKEQEFLDTVDELKSKKLIHAFGLSINRWEPENGIKALRTGRVDAVQVIYNIFDQNPEDKLFPRVRRIEHRRNRARAVRRRQPRRQHVQRDEVS